MKRRPVPALLLASAALAFVGCARHEHRDPAEGFNRAMFGMNERLDRYAMEPIARGYKRVVPRPVRRSVTNFFNNIDELYTIPNQLLQAKPVEALSDTGRFATNTTVGVLGLFDVARRMGLERHDEDLGQTLAVWGIPEGPYLVLPLLGPSTVRDFPGIVVHAVLNRILFLPASGLITTPLNILETVDKRAEADAGLEAVDKAAMDRYAFIREAFRQRRQYLIHDGSPPESGAGDLLDEEFDPSDLEGLDELDGMYPMDDMDDVDPMDGADAPSAPDAADAPDESNELEEAAPPNGA